MQTLSLQHMKRNSRSCILLTLFSLLALCSLAQVPQHISANGLVGWYPFQNGTSDLSIYGRHAQTIGATSAPDREGNANSAFYLNGQNSFLTIEHHTMHNSMPITVSAWMKPDNTNGGGPIISKSVAGFHNGWLIETMRGGDNDDAIMPSYMLEAPNMNDACACGCNGVAEGQGDCGTGINFDGEIFDGNWHLVTFVVSDTEGKLFVDGQQATSQAWAGNSSSITNTSDILIGALRSDSGPWSFFKGFVDEVGIWNRALTSAEVMALYTEEPLPVPCNIFESTVYESIVGHWPFCGNADDESPNDFHGQVNGALLTADAIGNAESAYHFANNSIELPVNADFLNSDFSVYLEYNMTEYTGESSTLFSCAGLTIQLTNACSPNCLSVYFLGEGYEFGHMDTPVSEGLWNSILVKRQEGVLWLYLNGMLWNAVEIEAGAIALNDSSVILGGTGFDSGNFTGDIDNVAIWTRALTDDEAFNIAMDSEFIVWGCTDPGACNFEPLATVDDWSCGYMDWPCDDGNPNTINDTYNSLCDCEGMWGEWQEGCTDPAACNFDWFAVVDNGSCHYPWSPCDDGDSTTTNTYLNWWCECVEEINCNDTWAINFFPNSTGNEDCEYGAEIYTFEDYNSNGTWDYNEPALGNWPLAILGSESLAYTDAYGYAWVVTNAFNGGLAASDSIYNDWHNTTPLVISTDWGWPLGVWGFSNSNPQGVSATITQHLGWPPIIHCESGLEVGAYINNSGAEPINAIVTITCSDTLQFSANTTPEIVALSQDTLVIENISSYDFELASFHIESPGLEFLDQYFAITICVVVFDSTSNVVRDTCFQYYPWVACSYDPNDLTANSPGHYEPHFISAGERVVFRVRFQNTGNYQAEDVLIRDLLNPQVWDIETFEPIAASVGGLVYDGLQTNLNPLTGEASFLLDGINLPDSSSSASLSQGFVTFAISTRNNLSHGTSLSNTAEIYFDNNPAIVTNTTNHTIFDCNTLTGIHGDTQICAGETLELDATQEYVDSYTWSVADISTDSSNLTADLLPQGEYAVTLQLNNPLCSVSHQSTVVVSAVPNNTIYAEGSSLWAEGGNQWQWFFDNEPIEGGTSQTITAETEGTYSVLVSNNANCEAEGVYHFIPNGVDEELGEVLSAWPNPMQSECRIQLPNMPCTLSLYDASGRLVKEEQLKGGVYTLNRNGIESGLYQLMVTTAHSKLHQKLIVE